MLSASFLLFAKKKVYVIAYICKCYFCLYVIVYMIVQGLVDVIKKLGENVEDKLYVKYLYRNWKKRFP